MAQLITKVKLIKESTRKLKNYPRSHYPEIASLTLVSILLASSAYTQQTKDKNNFRNIYY